MPQGPFLALITPIGDAGGGQPPQPSHPIQLPGMPGWGQIPGFTPGTPPPRPHPEPPLGIWGPGFPYPDQGLPGPQPPQPGVPTHPWVPPLGFWGPNDPRPTPPIYIPIMPPAGEGGEQPEHPIYIPVYPSHPIVIPPGTSPEEIAQKLKELVDFATGNLPTDPDEKPTPVK